MAAIIAQITRAKRERDKKKKYTAAKCMYQVTSPPASLQSKVTSLVPS